MAASEKGRITFQGACENGPLNFIDQTTRKIGRPKVTISEDVAERRRLSKWRQNARRTGQQGNGKTFTMQPLPLKTFEDILCTREDGKQQVRIVGFQEFGVLHVNTVMDLIERGNSTRSTGTTGANEESSRSPDKYASYCRSIVQGYKYQVIIGVGFYDHAILQLAIKKLLSEWNQSLLVLLASMYTDVPLLMIARCQGSRRKNLKKSESTLFLGFGLVEHLYAAHVLVKVDIIRRKNGRR